MIYPIEKGIPLPPLKKVSLYPFSCMEVDDSFAFPAEKETAVRQAALKHAKKHGRRYCVSGKHLRCWRTA